MFNDKFNNNIANKFNKKLTKQNDFTRFQNIHKKTNQSIQILKQPLTSNNINIPITEQNIFQLDKLQTSVNLNIDISRDNLNINNKIPKILFKEVPIPSYSKTDKFDLNTINQKISTPIRMNIFASDTFNEGDINRLKKKKIYKIIHIYQEKYAQQKYTTGLGDFIRSCFFIIQFCKKYDFQCEIIINHPIAQFLNKFMNSYFLDSNYKNILNNNVFMFSETNWAETIFDNEGKNYVEQFLLLKQKFNSFVDYLCSLPIINHSVISYNILFPYDPISTEESNIIRSIFEPSREINEYIDFTLNNISLIKKQFIVFHIRSGDSYLKNENKIFNSLYFEIIKNEIIEIIFKNKNTDILLIADNNEIKLLINQDFPRIKFIINDITHLGEGVILEREKIKNTLLDFYLMSYASYIYSFTSYPHGSGFSYWCSKIYNILYKCKYINVK